MCYHVAVIIAAWLRRHSDPGHDNNAGWTCRTFWDAGLVLVAILLSLAGIAFVIEFLRNRHHIASDSWAYVIPSVCLVLMMFISLVAVLELACLFPTFGRTLRAMAKQQQRKTTDPDDLGNKPPFSSLAPPGTNSASDNSSNTVEFSSSGDDAADERDWQVPDESNEVSFSDSGVLRNESDISSARPNVYSL